MRLFSFILLMPFLGSGILAQEISEDRPEKPDVSQGRPTETSPSSAEKRPAPAGLPLLSSMGRRNETALKLFQAGARVEYLAALELKDQGSLRQALGRFENFRTLYPAHSGEPLVLRHIADIYERLSMPSHALREIRRYTDAHPALKPVSDVLPLFVLKADLEYRLGKWPDALATTRLLLKANPSDPGAPRLRERLRELQRALATEAPGGEERERDGRKKDVSHPDGPATPAKDQSSESSLDRLGEGLDDEK